MINSNLYQSLTFTYFTDERAEREEVEAARQRELALAEAQAVVEEEALAMESMVGPDGAALDDEADGGRDLDADVPSADEEGDLDAGWLSEGSEVEGEGGTMLEDEGVGEGGVDEDVDLEGVEGGMGMGDLDDEVPDAEEGSYEHTDTEVEDSSDDGGVVGRGGLVGPRLGTFNTRTGEVVRTSGGGSARRGGR